ncbi:MAG: exonuclease SbcCD subunit D [Subdoligranulum sp.]|nr:exonuclease SbcCD subunit D [Subdoligranulum sp.]MDY5923789.1 exonuclease SbcCD subunit D [Oscillospiraceae bacterium]
MKLIHLSDIHLGKRVNEFSMLEDQAHILKKILAVVDEEKPDGVLIAGDVYDKSVPSTEAVQLFDDFLVRLAERKLPVFIISGNHDSPERLSFANRLIDAAGIHLAPVYNGVVEPITLSDEYGPVNVYMLPFIKPAHVRGFFPDTEITGYSDAVAAAIGRMNIDKTQRNVLITHQFVTGAQRSDSEELSVGGTDNIGAEVFCDFDYVALGHIHGPQNMDSGRIRYCGSPLKYSFSEAAQQKSVTVAELKEKGTLEIHTVPLIPRRDMVELKGSYQQLTLREFYENTTYQEDYTHITLTDEEDIPDAVAKLRAVYHNLMKLDYDNTRTRHSAAISGAENVETRSPIDLFAEFYELQNGLPMSAEQTELVASLIEKIWEGEE